MDKPTITETALKLKTSDVVFRDDLYPRIEHNPATVQQYATALDMLPPIEVNQGNVLIDGWHRWTAHKKAEAEEIAVTVTQTSSDAHFLEMAIERNAKHGLQLSQNDKHDMARKIYSSTPLSEQGEKKKHLAEILSVPDRTMQKWTSRIDKDNKEERDTEIAKLHLACWTQEEIAEAVGISHQAVSKVLQQFATLRFVAKPGDLDEIEDECERLDALQSVNLSLANQTAEFKPPLYNIWKQQNKSGDLGHFGNSESTWLDNLLYLYTKPFDVVVDPFAGGGSTIDVCRKRFPSNLLCGLTMWLIATVRPCRTCRLSWWREMAS